MYTIIGVITSTHGIRGHLKVYPYTDDVNRFKLLDKVYLGDEKIELHVKEVSFFKNLVIIGFNEFNNINEVLKFKDFGIYILDEDRMPLDKDRYYISDLVGCTVLDLEGKELGIISEVIQGAANDVYVIKSKGSSGMIPAVKEFIKEVNIEERFIKVDVIEGMFDENWHFNLVSWIYGQY